MGDAQDKYYGNAKIYDVELHPDVCLGLMQDAMEELRGAAWDFKTEITSAMVMQEGGTLVNLYAKFVNQSRIQKAHDRLLAAIKVADNNLKAG